MDTESQAQADPSSATATAAAVDTTTSQPDTSNLDLAQLDTLFEKGSLEVPVVGAAAETKDDAKAPAGASTPATVTDTPVEKEPAAAAGKEAEPVAPATEEGAPATTPEPKAADDEVERIQRPRLKNPVDQQIAAVFKAAEVTGEPISWAEAERRVKGDPVATTTTAVTETAPAQAEPDLSEVVDTLQGEVQTIKDRLSELGDAEGLLTPEYSRLSIELAEKSADLKLATRDLAQAEKAAQNQAAKVKAESEAARLKSRSAAVEKWPALNEKASPLAQAVAKRVAEMRDPNHPDHAILYADSAPLTIARAVAEEMGIAPVVAPSAAAKPTTAATPPATPRKVVSPQPGHKTSVPAGKPAEDAKQTLDYLRSDASLEELDAAFGAGDMSRTIAAVASR